MAFQRYTPTRYHFILQSQDLISEICIFGYPIEKIDPIPFNAFRPCDAQFLMVEGVAENRATINPPVPCWRHLSLDSAHVYDGGHI